MTQVVLLGLGASAVVIGALIASYIEYRIISEQRARQQTPRKESFIPWQRLVLYTFSITASLLVMFLCVTLASIGFTQVRSIVSRFLPSSTPISQYEPVQTPSSTPTISATSIQTTPNKTIAADPTATLSSTPAPTHVTPQRLTATPSPPIPQTTTIFEDDFNGTNLDSSIWTLDSTSNSVSVQNGILRMESSGIRYPYIYANANPFPTAGDFETKFRFRYAKVGVCGVGILLTSYFIRAGLSQNDVADRQRAAEEDGVAVGVWQDIKNGFQIWFRSGTDRKNILLPSPDTAFHTMTIAYTGNRYRIYFDGNLNYISLPTPYRPQLIWLGHPASLGTGFDCPWDTLEVDEIAVKTLP